MRPAIDFYGAQIQIDQIEIVMEAPAAKEGYAGWKVYANPSTRAAIPVLAILAWVHRPERADARKKLASTVCFTAVRLQNGNCCYVISGPAVQS